MSTKELLEAVAAVPMPDFHIRNQAGVFHIQALTPAGRNWLLDNVKDVSGPELIGGTRFDRISALELIDGIFDSGLCVV